MANSESIKTNETKKVTHPGSSLEDAKAVGGKGDFGVAEANVAERTYTSQNTKHADPGAAQPRSGEDDSSRESGAGGPNSGPGSSSGGDLDTDIVGLGNGGGVSVSGSVHEPAGPDDATGTSADFASGKPSKTAHRQTTIPKPTRGSTVQLPDDSTTSPQGADGVATSDAGDDASAGEVSSDEASGRNDAGD